MVTDWLVAIRVEYLKLYFFVQNSYSYVIFVGAACALVPCEEVCWLFILNNAAIMVR